uniref:Uncharacterized protein n=1 Tax=viral metagenome TaxID=1070528 RepID=A0A6C0AFV3_9ZZZZ
MEIELNLLEDPKYSYLKNSEFYRNLDLNCKEKIFILHICPIDEQDPENFGNTLDFWNVDEQIIKTFANSLNFFDLDTLSMSFLNLIWNKIKDCKQLQKYLNSSIQSVKKATNNLFKLYFIKILEDFLEKNSPIFIDIDQFFETYINSDTYFTNNLFKLYFIKILHYLLEKNSLIFIDQFFETYINSDTYFTKYFLSSIITENIKGFEIIVKHEKIHFPEMYEKGENKRFEMIARWSLKKGKYIFLKYFYEKGVNFKINNNCFEFAIKKIKDKNYQKCLKYFVKNIKNTSKKETIEYLNTQLKKTDAFFIERGIDLLRIKVN